MRPRVLLLSSSADRTSGWGTFTHEFCKQLHKRGTVEFELALPRGAAISPNASYLPFIRTDLPSWRGSLSKAPLELINLYRYDPQVSYDLIHSIVEFPYAILSRNLASQRSVPYIVTLQGTYAVAPLSRKIDALFYKPALRDARFLTAPSRFTSRRMMEVSGLERSVKIIHNAVDYARFQAPTDRRTVEMKYEIPPGTRVILSVGALKWRKGFDVLIRAFAQISAASDDVILLIAGEGPARESLVELAEKLGISARVRLLGTVRGDSLLGLYQMCTAFVLLPRYSDGSFEGFGIVYLEAGACAKPVVGTRSGGVPDAIVDGETGILVGEDNYLEAWEAMSRLLEDSRLSRRLGESGRRRAAQHTWEWYVDEALELYWEAMGD